VHHVLVCRYVFASDIAPGRHATDAALTARTSQTIARLLGANRENDGVLDADHRDDDHPSASPLQPYVHVAPPHTRVNKSKPETAQLSPLASDNADASAFRSARLETKLSPAKDVVEADPRFDENRWDNEFLGPLLPMQVVNARSYSMCP
jgi:hypothetical protein